MSSRLTRNRRVGRGSVALIAALSVLLAASAGAVAQSGTRSPMAQRTTALEGYCPVCVIEMKKWVRGKPEYQATYDGQTYFFPGPDQKKMFLADPAKYVPALGGDCTVCFVNRGTRVPGSIRFATLYDNRLFLFPSADQKKEFVAQPDKYAHADLALDGKCAVCRVEMNRDVPGRPEIAAFHRGFRYLFPSEEQRQRFLANPQKYASEPAASGRHALLENAATRLVTIQGKTGCAGCDHGVVPLGSPDELGLAVNAADGNVYVVEDAHKQ